MKVCVKIMSMIKKYLIREQNFWTSGVNKNNETCLVKHDEKIGGIYAYISGKTVKLVSSYGTVITDQFKDVESYFHGINAATIYQKEDLMNVLNRRQISNKLQRLDRL